MGSSVSTARATAAASSICARRAAPGLRSCGSRSQAGSRARRPPSHAPPVASSTTNAPDFGCCGRPCGSRNASSPKTNDAPASTPADSTRPGRRSRKSAMGSARRGSPSSGASRAPWRRGGTSRLDCRASREPPMFQRCTRAGARAPRSTSNRLHAASDVMGDRLVHVVLGFSPADLRIAVLDWGSTTGDTNDPEPWEALAARLHGQTFAGLPVSVVSVDSGWSTTAVRRETARRRWWIPCKGIPGEGRPICAADRRLWYRLCGRRRCKVVVDGARQRGARQAPGRHRPRRPARTRSVRSVDGRGAGTALATDSRVRKSPIRRRGLRGPRAPLPTAGSPAAPGGSLADDLGGYIEAIPAAPAPQMVSARPMSPLPGGGAAGSAVAV